MNIQKYLDAQIQNNRDKTFYKSTQLSLVEKKFGSKTRFLLLKPQVIKSKLKNISFDLNHQFGSVKFSISKDIALKMKKKQDKSIILTDIDGSILTISHNGNDTHININDAEDERTIVIDCDEYNSIIEFIYSSFK